VREQGLPTEVLARLTLVATTLTDRAPVDGDVVDVLENVLSARDSASTWLFLAVVRGRLPDVDDVEAAMRRTALEGAGSLVECEIADAVAEFRRDGLAKVAVLPGAVTVDVQHTASVSFLSGIQRVVRETVVRWNAAHDLRFVGWTPGFRAFRLMPKDESDRLLIRGDSDAASSPVPPGPPDGEEPEIVVPWQGVHLIPELTAEPERAARVHAMARFGSCQIGIIGYDCIPVTSADTVATGMSSAYARYLVSVRHSHRLAPISRSAAEEFRGWRRMVRAAGFEGPDIREVELPVQAKPSTDESLRAGAELLGLPGLSSVLVVGSHEPRKNHLAILHAAEVLWHEGIRFSLTFVGAASWRSESFYSEVNRLQHEGLPVASINGLSDDLLWAGYRHARFVMFPSFNEGFGLPIAEALSVGTPVITSDFGSMREIVAPQGEVRGALLINPRDDESMIEAMRTMLCDEAGYQRLRAEAASVKLGSWDDYASKTWAFLVDGAPIE